MRPEAEPLGDGTIHYLASVVADGTATPEEARQLLEEFVRQASSGMVTTRMTEHLRDCISSFLAGEKELLPSFEEGRTKILRVPITTMEKAFGLKRTGPGRAPLDRDTLGQVAKEVLEIRLQNPEASLEDAAGEVADRRKRDGLPVSSDSQVREAWAKYKAEGLYWLRVSRLPDVDREAPAWTQDEMARLTELFESEPWFVPPGVDPAEHLTATLNRLSRPEESAD